MDDNFLLTIAKFLAIVIPVYLAIYKSEQIFEQGYQQLLRQANEDIARYQQKIGELYQEIERLYDKIVVLEAENKRLLVKTRADFANPLSSEENGDGGISQ